jgi:sigma-B regulation protein RsbQ
MASSIKEKFNVNVSGNGIKAMMFAHGLGCDQSMWRFIIPAFEEDYKIVLFDYIGSGNADISFYNKEKYSSLHGYADDVIGIIKALQLSQVVFVGHSVSGMIGMLAAIKAPELFSNLIMVSPSPCYLNEKDYKGGFEKNEIKALLEKLNENLNEWSTTFAPIIMGNQERPALAEELKESFVATNHTALNGFADVTFWSDLRNELEALTTPTLIMQGSEDIIAPVEVGNFMHQKISGSKLVNMQATGHCAHLSEPKETVELIKEYLNCY